MTLGDGGRFGSLGDPDLDLAVERVARGLLDGDATATRTSSQSVGTVRTEAFVPDPRVLIVVGGTLAQAIVAQAAVLGWEAVVAADWPAATIGLDWAGVSAAVAMLSHDPDLDAPVLADAIRRRVNYLGALGSRRTQQHRADRLRGLGVPEEDIAGIHGPIGLDLGGNRPEHIAIAICAEILAHRSRRVAAPLRELDGPIRGRLPDDQRAPPVPQADGVTRGR